MKIILLERVAKLGSMGEIVTVKDGYARNALLPQGKALRASRDNLAFFDTQKAQLKTDNLKHREAAEKTAKTLEKTIVTIVRQASESGQLYGSVTSRDIATKISGITINRNQVQLNQAMKTVGLFPVPVVLHPEVSVTITLNIARSLEEAAIQLERGQNAPKTVSEETQEQPVKEEAQEDAKETEAEDIQASDAQ